MTFIASVIARKGVAIIADSLVTSEMPILHYQNFIDYLDAQPNNEQGEKIIKPDDIRSLFSHQPSYTKDYQEKLFTLNKFTAVTTTGIAYINDKSISDLLEAFKTHQTDLDDLSADVNTRLQQFSDFLNAQISEHLRKHESIGYCLFMITYYEKSTHKTHIYKAIVNQAGQDKLSEVGYSFVTLNRESEWPRVVCAGQNKISEQILYGSGRQLYIKFPIIVDKILSKLTVPEEFKSADFIKELIEDEYFNSIFFDDMEMLNLTELSLQQAVDLAALLMRLEVDLQKYTKNIPTVGGVIKLAVIDEEGFRYISGYTIQPPKHINL